MLEINHQLWTRADDTTNRIQSLPVHRSSIHSTPLTNNLSNLSEIPTYGSSCEWTPSRRIIIKENKKISVVKAIVENIENQHDRISRDLNKLSSSSIEINCSR